MQYIRPYGDTADRGDLPIYERLFLGGEYSIRGFDIRSVGPRDLTTGVVLGGNKSLLFNAEYIIQIAGPVRLVMFYDTGQVRDIGDSFGWNEDIERVVPPPQPILVDPLAFARASSIRMRPDVEWKSSGRPRRSRRRPARRSGSSCRCSTCPSG